MSHRVSGLWSDSLPTMDYDDEDGIGELESGGREGDGEDGRTPLDKTIDRIGMGSYQWILLALCGFGWMADNMWMQAVAIILPRVQQHFSVPDSYIGALSSAMFAGMMFGAVGWGACSDLMGRSTAFNLTLVFTSLFGLLASFANSFLTLSIVLFFLGSAVGGSMPTDGTLLLEYMPKGKQYLVTALSVFFSVGSVVSAVVALLVIPQHSCQASSVEPCDLEKNQGWKYLLMTLGLLTLAMFIARIVFFRLHESPRYLVHAGRKQEALESLQMISKYNGTEFDIGLHDVDDSPVDLQAGTSAGLDEVRRPLMEHETDLEGRGDDVVFDAQMVETPIRESLSQVDDEEEVPRWPYPHERQSSSTGLRPSEEAKTYHSVVPSPSSFSRTSPDTPPTARPRLQQHSPRRRAASRRLSTASSFYEVQKRVGWALPRWIRRPLWAWLDKIAIVFEPEWLRTTLLVWATWCSMALAYTMFNVYLPKLLEARSALSIEPTSLEDSLWDVVIFTLGGCPGALLGAWLVESPLGRRLSLASSTFVTAIFCLIFAQVEASWAVRASTVGLSLSSTTMWAVLYGWTPEIFDTKVRGSACGIASALSRIGGMIAPMLGGTLLMINRSVPVYTSAVIFGIAGVCVLLLDSGEGEGGREGGGGLMH